MHVDVQIVLVKRAGHADGRKDPQPEERIISSFSLLVKRNIRMVLCAIHMHVANARFTFILAYLLRSRGVTYFNWVRKHKTFL